MCTPRFAITVLVLIGLTSLAPATTSLAQGFLPFGPKVETDPKKKYELSEKDGPWMIMVGSFAGLEGERQAQDLALEIRRELRQPAYVYRHKVDLEEHHIGLGWEQPDQVDQNGVPVGDPVQQHMKLRNLQDFEEIAVLIGDFDSFDSSKIQKMLTKVKTYQPKVLSEENRRGLDAFLQNRIKQHFLKPEDRKKGPLRSAFICPNPLLPEEYFNPQGADRFIYDLNKDLEYSLLTCNKPYSLKVATFKGNTTFDEKFLDQKQAELNSKRLSGQAIESPLAAAADRAHRLTLALRERGVEAYEYHDRTSSYVCVGSFDQIIVKDERGLDVPHPQLVRLAQTFQPKQVSGRIKDSQGRWIETPIQPFTLKGYEDAPFDYTSEPVEVPYYSVANDYARDPTRR